MKRTGRWDGPDTKFEASHSDGPAASMSGSRVRTSRRIASISTRARWAPRQKCGPPPPKAIGHGGQQVDSGQHRLSVVPALPALPDPCPRAAQARRRATHVPRPAIRDVMAFGIWDDPGLMFGDIFLP